MKQVIQNYRLRKVMIEEVPMPIVKPGGVLVQNAYSLISAGTERQSIETARKSLIAKAKARPDQVKQVIQLAKQQGFLNAYRIAINRLSTPTPLGYSSAGVVIEVGKNVDEFKVGDRVACAGGGYANHAEVVFVPKNLCARVPDDVSLEYAAFTTLGAIALQGIRQADVKLGETVVVIGLGLLGQLTAQILKASGCRVIGLDIDKWKIDLAKKLGIDLAFNTKIPNLKSQVQNFTKGYGADAVIITVATEKNEPFLLAPEIIRDRGRVVLVGVAKIDFPREPYYRKELSLILSRSYGAGRYDTTYEEKGIDYPIGYVRWTEKRNMEAFLQLLSSGHLALSSLITHRFKIDDALKAYDLIMGKGEKKKEKYLGILLEYDIKKENRKPKIEIKKSNYQLPVPNGQVSVGFIGAGNFAQNFLLPNLKKLKGVSLKGIVTATGLTALHVGKKYRFEYCSSDYHELLTDSTINTIFIATRHDLHAKLIIESLKAGKNVFCEKPLCLNELELDEIIKVYNDQLLTTKLMVGFNRRFAPIVKTAKDFLGKKINPYIINYRINAGALPLDHWLRDPKEGGGRIIGEVCHFIDLISFFIQAKLERIYAEKLTGLGEITADDNVIITLRYNDGSIGTISYFAIGDRMFPKERIEIFGDEKVCIIDDFQEIILSVNGKQKRKRGRKDKGYYNEISEFLNSIINGLPSPIPFSSIIETTLATFQILKSLQTREPVPMPEIRLL